MDKVKHFFASLLRVDPERRAGLFPAEIAMVCYLLLTSVVLVCFPERFDSLTTMALWRVGILLVVLVLWRVYMLRPCKLLELLRVLWQVYLLNYWYPEIFEFNKLLFNCDHLVAGWEQSVFGSQPSVWFSEDFPAPVFSELMNMGYFSYYPMIVSVIAFYFFGRYRRFQQAFFVVMGGFFLYYLIFLLFPVSGPQFYFKAIGVDAAVAGVFPELGDYFSTHFQAERVLDYMLPAPGWEEGFFRGRVIFAQLSGERPMAAFPSSHCGVSTILMCLAWQSRCRKLFGILLPFYVLLVFSTVYIQAHYAVDAIAGVLSGVIFWKILTYVFVRRFED
jgi:membrane-associated phospholipid phosphatase